MYVSIVAPTLPPPLPLPSNPTFSTPRSISVTGRKFEMHSGLQKPREWVSGYRKAEGKQGQCAWVNTYYFFLSYSLYQNVSYKVEES